MTGCPPQFSAVSTPQNLAPRVRHGNTKAVMPNFSILPWEHRGAGASTAPHAQTRLGIGGRKRNFLLKMREGVIYFTEPKRAPVWAITRQFERELRGDELSEIWRREIERENYGRFVIYRPTLPGTSVSTTLSIIHRADYSGWLREWFARDWRQTPVHRDQKTFDIWGDKFQNATRRAYSHAADALVNRAMEPGERRDIPMRWVAGDEAELNRIFALVTRVFVRRIPDYPQQSGLFQRSFVASSPTNQGGWFSADWLSSFASDLQVSPAFEPILRLMETHFVLVGLSWKKTYARPKTPWGERWRGRWETVAPEIKLAAEIESSLSAHDRLEAQLEVRDWLHDKVSPRQSANWLSKALD